MNFFKTLSLRFWLIFSYTLVLVLCFGGFVYTGITPKNLVLKQNEQVLDSSKQQFFANYQEGQIQFSGTIFKSNFSQNIVEIQVDDCLDSMQINGQNVNLMEFTNDRFCSWDKGIQVDLGKYLIQGENNFIFTVANYGGEASLKINPNINDPVFLALFIISILAAFLLLYEIITGLKLDNTTALLFIAALAIRLIYYSYTGFNARQNDALGETGHLGYINYFATNWRLPDPATGFEYHQAPLYYIISGTILAGLNWLGLYNSFDVLQLFSIGFFLVFAFFGVKILYNLIGKNIWYYLGISLLLFWPSGIIHSVRITNDTLFWAIFAALIYYLIQFLDNFNVKNFTIICVLFALGMITKTSMILALPMIFVAVAIQFAPVILNSFQDLKKLQLVGSSILKKLRKSTIKFVHSTKSLILSLFGLVSVAISLVINPDFGAILSFKPLNEVIGSTQLNSTLKVGEGLQHYLFFDLKAFLTNPFMSSWSDESGRQWFWNFFLKSSLFGEFSFESVTSKNLAIGISFALIILLLNLVYYFFSVSKFSKKQWLMASILVIFVIGNMMHRKQNPYAPNSDFRFVFPALIPLTYFITTSIQSLSAKKHYLAFVLTGLSCLILTAFSITFFVLEVFA